MAGKNEWKRVAGKSGAHGARGERFAEPGRYQAIRADGATRYCPNGLQDQGLERRTLAKLDQVDRQLNVFPIQPAAQIGAERIDHGRGTGPGHVGAR